MAVALRISQLKPHANINLASVLSNQKFEVRTIRPESNFWFGTLGAAFVPLAYALMNQAAQIVA